MVDPYINDIIVRMYKPIVELSNDFINNGEPFTSDAELKRQFTIFFWLITEIQREMRSDSLSDEGRIGGYVRYANYLREHLERFERTPLVESMIMKAQEAHAAGVEGLGVYREAQRRQLELLYQPITSPTLVFEDAMAEAQIVRERLSKIGPISGPTARMFLVLLFSIIEAYLSDLLMEAIRAEGEIRRRLIQRVEALKQQQISLVDVANASDIVLERCLAHIRNASFHDFEAVDKIYRHAFHMSILPDDEEKKGLLTAIVHRRHDCVHRNGRTKTGEDGIEIDQDYLNQVAALFTEIKENAKNAFVGSVQEPIQ